MSARSRSNSLESDGFGFVEQLEHRRWQFADCHCEPNAVTAADGSAPTAKLDEWIPAENVPVGQGAALLPTTAVIPVSFLIPHPLTQDYYFSDCTSPEKPIQLQPGLSNFSCLVLGDDRITVTESIMSAQMRVTVEDKLQVASPSKTKAAAVRTKDYKDAKGRVSDGELDRLERNMKDKLVQRKNASFFQVMKAFKFFDRDQAEVVPIEGFTRALEFLGFQFSDLQNLALFARYDPDCTGEVDYAHFIATAMFEPQSKAGHGHSPKSTGVGAGAARGAAAASSANNDVDDDDLGVDQLEALQRFEMQGIFNKVDTQRRGALGSADEFELLLLSLGYRSAPDEVDAFWRDLSAVGAVTFDTFYAWWAQNIGSSLRRSHK